LIYERAERKYLKMVFKSYFSYEWREAIPEPIRCAHREAPAEREGRRKIIARCS
jgi:hypothetical protein